MIPALLAFAVLIIAAPFASRLLCRALGLTKPNFQKVKIPASVGLTYVIVGGVTYGVLWSSSATLGTGYGPVFLIVALGFGILGLLDDLYGNREVGGFKGHLKALFSGKLTTGAIKLIGGGLIALMASYLQNKSNLPLLLMDAAIIALAANAINLLDTRPGRALFGFALLTLPTLIGTLLILRHARFTAPTPVPDDLLFVTPPGVLLGPIIVAVATEWWPDARGKAMMGDVGANLLGAVAGLSAIVTLPPTGRLVLLGVLLALNLLAERISLNALFEKNRFFHAIDRTLGVRDAKS